MEGKERAIDAEMRCMVDAIGGQRESVCVMIAKTGLYERTSRSEGMMTCIYGGLGHMRNAGFVATDGRFHLDIHCWCVSCTEERRSTESHRNIAELML